MRIYSMTATFGKLDNETLTLQPGLNIIHAPNEWGKSTWCAFLVAMLYGIETRVHTTKAAIADKERYAPWSGAPMAGRIDLNWDGRDITIERSSKGRSVFGIFHAYETHTGLEVPELTAANCGQQLLGVEKSVFTRAGFLRLTDLPVTQDDSLRRRLNELVTTGDESGTADALAQKLRDLKNRCRLNRSTGLLPQAETQRKELQEKLTRLQELQAQSARLTQRLEQLSQHRSALENHQDALAYADSQTYAQKLTEAETALQLAKEKAQLLELECREMPALDEAEQAIQRLRQLREQKDALHMDAQLLPDMPTAPQMPNALRDIAPEKAIAQADADLDNYLAAQRKKRLWLPWLIGLLLLLGGAGCLLIPHWICKAAGCAVMIAGLICLCLQYAARRKACDTAYALQHKYDMLPASRWREAVEDALQEQADYEEALRSYQAERAELAERTEAIEAQLQAFSLGRSLAECEKFYSDAVSRLTALAGARKEHHRAGSLVQALRASHRQVQAPRFPDTMTYSAQDTVRLISDCAYEQRQLEHSLIRGQSQMDALGSQDALERQLEALNDRIRALEDTYAALELAQRTLSAASAELQRRFAPRISQRAQDLFSQLTAGRYTRLTLDGELAVQAATANESTLHGALWRSDGTVDQLYLALRLAVAEELTPEAPLVLDDALVRFDEQRLEQALQILREAAGAKQVILFTCQTREASLMDT